MNSLHCHLPIDFFAKQWLKQKGDGSGQEGRTRVSSPVVWSALQKSDGLVHFSGLRVKAQKGLLWNWDDTGSRLLGNRWRETLMSASRQQSRSLGHPAPSLGIFSVSRPSLGTMYLHHVTWVLRVSLGKTMHSDHYQRLSFSLHIPSTIVLEALYFGAIRFLI